MCLFYLILVVLIVSFLIWYKFNYYWYKSCLKNFKEIKYFPTNTTDFYNYLTTQSINDKMTKNCYKMFGPFPLFITTDEKLFSIILGSSKHINKPSQLSLFGKAISQTLFFAKNDLWRHRRRLFNSFFDYGSILNQFEINNERTNEFIDNFKSKLSNDKELIDLNLIINEFILGQVSINVMGENLLKINPEVLDILGFLNQQTVRKALVCTDLFKVWEIFKDLWLERKKITVLKNCIKKFLQKRINEKRNFTHGKRMIFVDFLIKEMNENNVSEEYVIQELLLFLFAGYETTAHSISFALYLLSKHPEIQENVIKEIKAITSNDITHQHLQKMDYLDLVIKESLRMYTTATFFFRILEENVEFEGTTLPKGLIVLFNNTGIHKDPTLYLEPEKFKPERFLSNEFKSKRFIYSPFCLGIRQCIGKRFAENTLKLTLAKFVLNYKLFDANHNLNLAIGIGLTSLNGIKVFIEKRR
nr:cytochrome P450 3A13-like [Onthophagus taurus]